VICNLVQTPATPELSLVMSGSPIRVCEVALIVIVRRMNRFRRLKVCYERRDDIHQAFLNLGYALICWRYVQRLC
jgi:hypothetical protein